MHDRGATRQLRPSLCAAGFRVAYAGAPLRSQSIGRWRSTNGCRARATCSAGYGHSMSYRRALHFREASLLRCKTVVRRASCAPLFAQPEFASHTRAHHCARSLSGGGALRAVAARVRRAARVLVVPFTMEGHCTGMRPLSFGARPWCDMPTVASSLHSQLSRGERWRATALAVSREEAQRARLPSARAALVCSVHTPYKATAPARGLFSSVQGRGAMCQLRPPVLRSRISRGARGCTTAFAVSREEAQHVQWLRTRDVPRGLWLLHTPARGLSSSVRDRGTTCQLRSPLCAASFRMARAGAPLHSLSVRRSTRAFRERAPRRAGCGRSINYKRPLHQREASLLRCETMVRRAGCGLPYNRNFA